MQVKTHSACGMPWERGTAAGAECVLQLVSDRGTQDGEVTHGADERRELSGTSAVWTAVVGEVDRALAAVVDAHSECWCGEVVRVASKVLIGYELERRIVAVMHPEHGRR